MIAAFPARTLPMYRANQLPEKFAWIEFWLSRLFERIELFYCHVAIFFCAQPSNNLGGVG